MCVHWESVFDFYEAPEDSVRTNPPVDVAPIVPDLKALALNGLDEVQVLRACDFAQHDVADDQGSRANGRDGAELSGLYPRCHGVSARTEGDRLAESQLFDVVSRPSHRVSNDTVVQRRAPEGAQATEASADCNGRLSRLPQRKEHMVLFPISARPVIPNDLYEPVEHRRSGAGLGCDEIFGDVFASRRMTACQSLLQLTNGLRVA